MSVANGMASRDVMLPVVSLERLGKKGAEEDAVEGKEDGVDNNAHEPEEEEDEEMAFEIPIEEAVEDDDTGGEAEAATDSAEPAVEEAAEAKQGDAEVPEVPKEQLPKDEIAKTGGVAVGSPRELRSRSGSRGSRASTPKQVSDEGTDGKVVPPLTIKKDRIQELKEAEAKQSPGTSSSQGGRGRRSRSGSKEKSFSPAPAPTQAPPTVTQPARSPPPSGGAEGGFTSIVRRQTKSVKIGFLWEALAKITHSGKPTTVDKIIEFLRKQPEYAKDIESLEADTQELLDNAVLEGLIDRKEGATPKGAVYLLPPQDYVPPDVHDWYCFKCHQPGSIFCCARCHRVYHRFCVGSEAKICFNKEKGLFTCPRCVAVERQPPRTFSQAKVNQMASFVLRRVEVQFSQLQDLITLRDNELWMEEYLVRHPLNVRDVAGRINARGYRRLEEFETDIMQIMHNTAVMFGDNTKAYHITLGILMDTRDEFEQIGLCFECYVASNLNNGAAGLLDGADPEWFSKPCHPPHEVVYAKQTGHPFWPAKVQRTHRASNSPEAKLMYDVRFFGDGHERATLASTSIRPFTTPISQLKPPVKKTAAWDRAYKEAQKHGQLVSKMTPAERNKVVLDEPLERDKPLIPLPFPAPKSMIIALKNGLLMVRRTSEGFPVPPSGSPQASAGGKGKASVKRKASSEAGGPLKRARKESATSSSTASQPQSPAAQEDKTRMRKQNMIGLRISGRDMLVAETKWKTVCGVLGFIGNTTIPPSSST
ncbi:unnamed protein product [Cyprideis torosa]|uniref:Uncharacterized protein n=1 Tax=Cyprideis torosa TaxID=163714 RepID=A0A7R8WPQ6_9CRUS|nr:unnamed protein product [Cyprideis torosa]CAG0901812.1 unnamed protein product [Cyprideis torosa]